MLTIPTDWVVYINFVLVIWFLIDLYRGYKRGLVLQIVDVVGTFVSLFAAWVLAPVFMNVYAFVETQGNGFISINQFIGQQVNQLIWFVLLFVIIRLVVMFVQPLAAVITKMPLIKQVNSIVGGVFAVVFFGVKLLILVILLSTPIVVNGQDVVENSWLHIVEDVSVPVLSTVEDFINRNDAIQSLIMEQKLPDEQTEAISDWLYNNGFTDKEIKEYLNNHE